MPNFVYELEDTYGRLTRGFLFARNMDHARERLDHRGFVVDVEEVPFFKMTSKKLSSIRFDGPPKPKDLLRFTKQLSVMLHAGIGIRSAIQGICERTTNPTFVAALEEIVAGLEAGQPFSRAINNHPKIFPVIYISMIEAAEESGRLADTLDDLSEYMTHHIETSRKVKGALIYPAVLMAISVLAVVFLVFFALPKFMVMFEGKEEALPAITVVFLGMVGFFKAQWYLIAGVLIGTIYGFGLYRKTPAGKKHIDALLLRLPLIGRMIDTLCITRSLRTLSSLIRSGVPLIKTLEVTAAVSGNEVYYQMWMEARMQVATGREIADTLEEQAILPSDVLQMIHAGEVAGKLDYTLDHVVEFYTGELDADIHKVTVMIEPLMIVIMGGVVGFIAMSIILPIFKISNTFK
jgi:type IV pilus assembly protein PilC